MYSVKQNAHQGGYKGEKKGESEKVFSFLDLSLLAHVVKKLYRVVVDRNLMLEILARIQANEVMKGMRQLVNGTQACLW